MVGGQQGGQNDSHRVMDATPTPPSRTPTIIREAHSCVSAFFVNTLNEKKRSKHVLDFHQLVASRGYVECARARWGGWFVAVLVESKEKGGRIQDTKEGRQWLGTLAPATATTTRGPPGRSKLQVQNSLSLLATCRHHIVFDLPAASLSPFKPHLILGT